MLSVRFVNFFPQTYGNYGPQIADYRFLHVPQFGGIRSLHFVGQNYHRCIHLNIFILWQNDILDSKTGGLLLPQYYKLNHEVNPQIVAFPRQELLTLQEKEYLRKKQ